MSSVSPGSPAALRTLNRARVLDVLATAGEVHQAELARATGLAAATVSNIVRELSDSGLVTTSRHGRRTSVRLTQRPGFVAGIDIGHRHVTVAIADLAAAVLAEEYSELEESIGAVPTVARAGKLLNRICGAVGIGLADVSAVGVGLPGPIDRTGRVGAPMILPSWVGVNAAVLVATELGISAPVVVSNDANLGALAEHRFGAAIGVDNLAYLKIGAGVGAGLMVDGRMLTGANGTAGEIGHISYDEYGEVCRCGNRGCLETLVAAPRVAALLSAAHPVTTVDELLQHAAQGHRPSVRVLEDAGRQIGRAMADLCNVVNPELIVVGGQLAQAHEILLPAVEMVISRSGVPAATADLRLAVAELGRRSHIVGALTSAADHVMFNS